LELSWVPRGVFRGLRGYRRTKYGSCFAARCTVLAVVWRHLAARMGVGLVSFVAGNNVEFIYCCIISCFVRTTGSVTTIRTMAEEQCCLVVSLWHLGAAWGVLRTLLGLDRDHLSYVNLGLLLTLAFPAVWNEIVSLFIVLPWVSNLYATGCILSLRLVSRCQTHTFLPHSFAFCDAYFHFADC
jgi:hypothetical protein